MLHLVHSISPLSFSSINNQKYLGFLSGFRNLGLNNDLLTLKKISRINGAMERESEFEVDPDKAREALRKLDQQLESLSNKPANSPKIRAVDLDQASPRMSIETSEISGSLLTFLASALLVFTIFYNVIFITVIKPSIDLQYAEEPVSASNVTKGTQQGAPVPQLLTSRKFPVGM